MKADDICGNCGREFADHEYIKDSISDYLCPEPHIEHGYGFFHGGDPRKFFPDAESCSPKELENHKAACKLWDEAERNGKTPTPEECPSGWICDENGRRIAHILRSPYGIGSYTAEFDQHWEPADGIYDIDDLII